MFGPTSNHDFLRRILTHDAFATGNFDIDFVGTHMADATTAAPPPTWHKALAAAALYHEGAADLAAAAGLDASLIGWRSSHASEAPLRLAHAEATSDIRLTCEPAGRYRVRVDDDTI